MAELSWHPWCAADLLSSFSLSHIMASGLKATQKALCEVMVQGSALNKWGIDVSCTACLSLSCAKAFPGS